MAYCKACDRDMVTAPGCAMTHIEFADGTEHVRVLHGDEAPIPDIEPMHICDDCGAETGHPHHQHCDLERCPRCGGQLLSCECEPVATFAYDAA